MIAESFIYGFSQLVATVYLAIGTAIVSAACIVWLSRWYRRRDVLKRIEEVEL